MAVLRNPAWWVPVLLFLLHQLLQYGFGISLPLIDAYLDPLLAPPVLLGLLSLERGYLFGRPRLDPVTLIVFVLLLALCFEVVFPVWEARFVGDWVDVACYVTGTLWFARAINPAVPSGSGVDQSA